MPEPDDHGENHIELLPVEPVNLALEVLFGLFEP